MLSITQSGWLMNCKVIENELICGYFKMGREQSKRASADCTVYPGYKLQDQLQEISPRSSSQHFEIKCINEIIEGVPPQLSYDIIRVCLCFLNLWRHFIHTV